MSKIHLALQVLGTNDVSVDGKKQGLWKEIQGASLEDVREGVEYFQEGNYNIDFPLVQKLIDLLKEPNKSLKLGIILSDQEEWAEQKELENSNQQIGQLVAKDGKWAKSFLESWLKEK
ncbi:hypothetical protein, partial [Hyella patelloides]|uniref:hypothetical protein n=1 Tax=Hyella patelloides TaxID=1982969 RepID=UPI0011A0DE9A